MLYAMSLKGTMCWNAECIGTPKAAHWASPGAGGACTSVRWSVAATHGDAVRAQIDANQQSGRRHVRCKEAPRLQQLCEIDRLGRESDVRRVEQRWHSDLRRGPRRLLGRRRKGSCPELIPSRRLQSMSIFVQLVL